MVFFDNAKKKLQVAIVQIKMYIGRRYRLKLKRNYQVCKFYYKGRKKVIGRPLDFMGFLFYRSKTILRKSIMISATQMARKLKNEKDAGRGYYAKHINQCSATWDGSVVRIPMNAMKNILNRLSQ